jgi:lycopene cyclase domain-containing protein
VSVIENITSTLVPSLIVLVIFSEIAVFLTGTKVWEFNPAYIIGINYRGLPLEEYLFIFTFSSAGLGIYNYLNAKFPKNDLQKYSLAISHALMGVCVAMLFFAYTKWYPAIIFSFLMLLLIGVEYINTLRFMYKFYRAFIIALIPFYICYAIICNLPITTYQTSENLGFNLVKIPLENHFFMMGMLLLGVYLLEFFKRRKSI